MGEWGVEMTEAAHAFLAPSSAYRWGPDGCPNSPHMEAHYPEDEESPEAREGTAAHYFVTEALSGRTVSIGELAPNGVPITAEMVECGQDLIRDVQDTAAAIPNHLLYIETRVTMTSVHAYNWGTPDAYMICISRRVLFLWDYKFGHRYVDAFRNWQCVDYSIGALERHGIPREEWHLWHITIAIAQPRNYHPDGPLREWRFNGAELVTLAEKLRVAALLVFAPNPALKTGEHCRDCRARHACPALQRVGMSLVDISMTGQPVDLPLDALGLELRITKAAIARLTARATGLEEMAKSLAEKRVSIPHWHGEYGQGRQRWTIPPADVIAMGQLFGVDLAKPTSLTPLQAIKKGLDPDFIKEISETPRGGMTLVPFDSDHAAKRFS